MAKKDCKICGGTGEIVKVYAKQRGVIIEEKVKCECEKEEKEKKEK